MCKAASYCEYLIAATHETGLRFAVTKGRWPDAKQEAAFGGARLDKLWIGSLILVLISLIGLTNILWNAFAHR